MDQQLFQSLNIFIYLYLFRKYFLSIMLVCVNHNSDCREAYRSLIGGGNTLYVNTLGRLYNFITSEFIV